jgi:hypothetical protein
MENMLKPLQPIEEVVAEVFLKTFPNFVTLKPSAKTFARRCSPCSGFVSPMSFQFVD